ncbi:hypothetical protein Scep_022604 [Stephania cephalantha]|uniref:Uncharacterized protein n=1 Tax=Stephania cephalantha TaxID=152367 RepID=A0AAP0F5R6_9MAGN
MESMILNNSEQNPQFFVYFHVIFESFEILCSFSLSRECRTYRNDTSSEVSDTQDRHL